MNIVPRVATSAQSALAHGSPVVRQKQIQGLCDDFRALLICTRKEKLARGESQLFHNDLQDCFVKLYPGKDVEVKKEGVSAFDWGSVGPKFDDNKFATGYLFNSSLLDFRENLMSYVPFKYWIHENSHISDLLINTKKMARASEIAETFDDNTQEKLSGFYRDKIYEYSVFQKGTVPKEKRLDYLKSNIHSFFEKENFSSNQKILLLQDWRYSVDSEVVATREEIHSMEEFQKYLADAPSAEQLHDKEDFQEDIVKYKKQINENLFPEKAELLGNMLREEIASHRKAHAESLRAKNNKSG